MVEGLTASRTQPHTHDATGDGGLGGGSGWTRDRTQWIVPKPSRDALGCRGCETNCFRNSIDVCFPFSPLDRVPFLSSPLRAAVSSPEVPTSPQSPATGDPQAAPAQSGSLEVIRRFAETYAQRTDTYFCADLGVTAVVLEGLARHKDDLGAALCPCRHYEDKEAEVHASFWNCP